VAQSVGPEYKPQFSKKEDKCTHKYIYDPIHTYVSIYAHICIHVYIYIYIYREREREHMIIWLYYGSDWEQAGRQKMKEEKKNDSK
jgi:hypothetical protein